VVPGTNLRRAFVGGPPRRELSAPAHPSPASVGGPVERLLRTIHAKYRSVDEGVVADYIPMLAKADPSLFGVALTTLDGHDYAAGDSAAHFTIQSVSKPFVYALALRDRGMDDILSRIGVEPTGDEFNAFSFEEGTGRPLNPLVNAGAILSTSLVYGQDAEERFERILAGLSAFAGRQLTVDESVYASEQETGDRNRAIAYLMHSSEVLQGDVDEICSTYFRQCAVVVTCQDLAVMAATLANGGVNPRTGKRVLSDAEVSHVLTVMGTCGMYDRSGEWLVRVGLPAKSGVGGGICAVLPGHLGIGTFSPPLDEKGNSLRGVLACRDLSERFALHLFRPPARSVHPVRRTYRGGAVTSKRVRPPRERALLRRLGAAIVIHELQGCLDFAAAERLVWTARKHLDGARWIVLDLRRVGAIDEPAVPLLSALLDELAAREITTLFADPRKLSAVGILLRSDCSTKRLRDTETALEWAEEALLIREDLFTIPPTVHVPLGSQELLAGLQPEDVALIQAETETHTYERGEVVYDEGDPANALYFITRGLVNMEVSTSGHRWFRLQTVPAGSAFGELALVDGGTRTTRIVVAETAVCEVLSTVAFEQLLKRRPGAGYAIFRAIARSLSSRLRQTTREIQALEAG
jgi:glutaminase